MDPSKIIHFCEDKLRAYTTSPMLSPATGNSIRASYELHIANAKSKPKLALGLLRSLDKELDVTMRSFLTRAEITRISSQLKSHYSFSSLSNTGDKVASRVLKRDGIKGAEEAQVLRDFLNSGEYLNEVLTKDQVTKLEELLAHYEKSAK